MNTDFDLAIVIPCYEEAKRIKLNRFRSFLKRNDKVLLCLVNDGSADNTLEVLGELKEKHPSQIFVIDMPQNQGKAEAVRTGFLKCLKEYTLKRIAYLDADLSTSLEECFSISQKISSSTYFAFGSRIAKIDTNIDRKSHRFFIGRGIATLISRQLNLKVYDTQCGCKVFAASLAKILFKEEFISRWLFDVELFHRLIGLYGKDQIKHIAKEMPLQSWCDTDDSKVPLTYFFKLWIDLRNIGKTYKISVQPKRILNEAIR